MQMMVQKQHPDLVEFFLFDVKLNRAVEPAHIDGGVPEPDKVVMAWAYDDDDIDQQLDHKYQTAIAFLPGKGLFYCAQERRKSNSVAMLLNTLIPSMDMSWLQITKKGDDNLLKFGSDEKFPSAPVLGWRVTAGRGNNQRRSIFRAFQCADHDGPRMLQ